MQNLINLLSQKTLLNKEQITNILNLLDDSAIIPFIIRCRKDVIGAANDEVLRNFAEIYISSKKLLQCKNEIYLDSAIVYPDEPRNDYENSKYKMLQLVKKYKISGATIRTGTGSHQTQKFFSHLNKKEKSSLNCTVVSESGASACSAFKIAQDEYPQLDATTEGAISVAQQLHDPMVTLVKNDSKSLGIGRCQYDISQKQLEKKLDDTVSDLVNSIGIDTSSASFSLLSYISDIGENITKNIIDFRNGNGSFVTKSQLFKVKGLSKKAYEQFAGFICIKNSSLPFENAGIHPESSHIAKKLIALDLSLLDVSSKAEELMTAPLILNDTIRELLHLAFNPREDLPPIPSKEDVADTKMPQEGSFVSIIVGYIINFGTFIDIGLKNDGVIHISKMGSKRISHPPEVLSLNQYLPSREVISIDKDKDKVGFSL